MSKRLSKATTQYFLNPLVQGKYKVIPPPTVPSHIIKPPYVGSENPIFGKYDGPPTLHTPQTVQKLKKSAQIACKSLQDTRIFIQSKAKNQQPLTQQDIDKFVFQSIVTQQAYPTPIGFMHFPKSVCVSVNQCFVHGIPSTRPLDPGDKINIDISVYFDGHHGDNNLTVFYGEPKQSIKKTVAQVAQKALYDAIGICKPGMPFNQVGLAIERVAQQNGLWVCQQFSGHGIGHLLHMPPLVYHRYYPQYSPIMQVGNVFTIQPVLTLFSLANNIHIWKDDFTAISNNNPNAQFQHTIAIVQGGCQILTLRPSQKIPNPYKTIKNV